MMGGTDSTSPVLSVITGHTGESCIGVALLELILLTKLGFELRLGRLPWMFMEDIVH